jgi:hypothetical protein
VIINTGKTFKGVERFQKFFGNVLPVLISLKKSFGSISLCEMMQIDLFIHCAHFNMATSGRHISQPSALAGTGASRFRKTKIQFQN